VLLGTFFRNFAGSVVTYFLPVFFLKNFAAFKAEYSLVNSLCLSVLGLISGLIGGVISDKFESRNYFTKSLVCSLGSVIAFPLICYITLQTSNFWGSMACFSVYTLVSAAFSGPAITMMQNSSKKSMQGSIISAYFFVVTIA